MQNFFTLIALTAAITFAGAASAGTTQTDRTNQIRLAHQAFQASQATYALTGQTAIYNRADRPAKQYANLIRGGRSAR